MKVVDPEKFDDEYETWWKPLHALWPINDTQWMAERQKLWKKIEKNEFVKRMDKHRLRGYRNIFLTGRQYEKEYHYLNDASRYMFIGDSDRLALIPTADPESLKLFTDHCPAKDWEYMKITSFLTISHIYKNTGLANDRVLNIYRYVMGGGELQDNKWLLSKTIENFEDRMESELRSYFYSLNRLLPISTTKNPLSHEDYQWLLSMFDYYVSISEMLCGHQDLIRSKYYWEKQERESSHQNETALKRRMSKRKKWAVQLVNIDCATTTGNLEQDKVLFKLKALIHSDRFPEVYREFWREFGG